MITPRLLEAIDRIPRGVVATVTSTEGHTYRKSGAKAVFLPDEPFAAYGNLGSLCADQEIQRAAAEALATGRCRIVRIDTRDPSDALFGYGTACGGMMEILVEPIDPPMKEIYRTLRERHLRENRPAYLVHNLERPGITLTDARPDPRPGCFVEPVPPRTELVIFGATPLAARLIESLLELPFRVHLADWRPAALDRFRTSPDLILHPEPPALRGDSFVLVLSHSFERDLAFLRAALDADCRYVGLLSSPSRRDALYAELRKQGTPDGALRRVRSPVGIEIGARSDPELAVSILAEVLGELRR